MKWTFEDLDTAEVWTFLRNPYEMMTPTLPRGTRVYQKGLAFRPGSMPRAWSFKGRVATQEEYDILLDWSKRGRIRITDHLERVHIVQPMGFDPTPRRAHADRPWRFLYTFRALYLEREA